MNIFSKFSNETQNSEKFPPCAPDVEKKILSSMLQEPEKYVLSAKESGLVDEHFYKLSHQKLASIIFNHFDEGKPLDMIYLTELLRNMDILENLGGAREVADIYTCEHLHTNFDSYVTMIQNAYSLRKIIEYGQRITSKAYSSLDNYEAFLSEFNMSGEDFRTTFSESNKPEHALELYGKTISSIEDRSKNLESSFLPTPWKGLNIASHGGLTKGEMHFFCGRPSAGKSIVGIELANHFSSNGEAVCYHSFETSSEGLMRRVIANRNNFPINRLITGSKFTKGEVSIIRNDHLKMKDFPLWIKRYPNANRLEVGRTMRRMIREENCNIHIIDYLQRCDPANENEWSDKQRIDNFLREMDQVRRSTGCTIIMLAQLNREADGLDREKLRLNLISDTSQAEKDADTIWFILKGYDNKDLEDEKNQRAFYCMKGRDTGIGQRVFLELQGEYSKLRYVHKDEVL